MVAMRTDPAMFYPWPTPAFPPSLVPISPYTSSRTNAATDTSGFIVRQYKLGKDLPYPAIKGRQ